ncbi:MAG: TRAP transporter substrate-binding protein DctP [Pseudomonadota bacterium]|nr:TRAP transporter substrate-binding protein DctP [Pseudomonadota bacterium]
MRTFRLANVTSAMMVGAAALAAALALPATAAAQTVFKMSSQWNENTVSSEADRWWASEIDRRTAGQLKVKLYYAGALAKAAENLQLIRSGGVELVNMSASYFGAELLLFTAPNSIPMAMAEVPQASQLMRRLMTEVPALDAEAERNGVKALYFHNLNPYLLVCRDPVSGLKDMRGKKIRTWGSDMPKMVQAAGGVPVTLGLTELYEGLSRGTVDCIPFSVDLMVNYKIYEVAKHVYDVTLWLGPTSGVWINRATWNGLPATQQKVLQQVSFEAADKDRDLTLAAATTAVMKLKAEGVQFHSFPEADKKAWKAANPDFFAAFIEAQSKAGRGDAAKKMVSIWSDVVGN